MKKSILISLLLLGSLVFADTPPPGSVQIRGGTDNTIIGNSGNALNVNVTGGSGASTANQGTPNSPSNAWPVYLPSPIPSQTVSVSNFPSPPSNQDVTVTNFPSTQNIAGTVNIGNFPSPQPTQPVSGTVNVGNLPSVQTITGNIGVLNFPTNQNVTITGTPTITVGNPSTNYALESGGNLASINTTLNTINGKFTNPLPVSISNIPSVQPISGTVSISGTVPVTGNVGITGTVGVNGTVVANIGTPGGLALNSTLQSIQSNLPASLGQATMANSFPVVISSNQSAIPVTGSFTATNASIGLNGSSAPTSSTEIGAVDSFGNLQHLNITGAGALKTDSSAVTQPVSGSISVSNLPSNQNVTVTNASIPVTGIFYQSIQPVSQSGSWTMGRTWNLSSGTDSVNIGNFPSTFGVTQATSPWIISGTVTSNIGTTGGLALDSTVSGLQVTQGSTTLGQSGDLIQGAVSSASPSYVNGKTDPLSLTMSGALRIDGSATTQPVTGSGTFTVVQPTGSNLHVDIDSGVVTVGNQISNYAQESGGNLAIVATNTNQLSTIATNTLNTANNVNTVNTTLGTTNTNTGNTATNTSTIIANQTNGTQKTQVTSTVPPNDTVSTGTLSSVISVVTIPANGIAGGGITISGAFSGDIQIQGSTTGGMYQNIETLQSGIWTYSPITAPGFYKFRDADGYQTVNALFTSYSSGSPTVRIEGTTAVGSIAITNPTPENLNATVYQPTGTNLHAVIDSGTISISSSVLPTGAATAANQATQITDLGTLISNQTNGTQETQVTNFPSVQPVSQSGAWAVTASQGTSPWVSNVSQFGSNNVVTGTGISGLGIPRVTVSTDSNILATQSGSWTTGRTWSLSESSDSVSSWLFDGSGNSIGSTTGSLNVDITNTVPVSQSGTWNLNNISGVVSLPTGASTATNQSTEITHLANIETYTENTSSYLADFYSGSPLVVNQGTSPWVISGTITSTDASIGLTGSPVPGSATFVGFKDSSGNLNSVTLTSAGAIPIDGSGVTQPVSGTVTSNQGGTWNLTNVSGIISLPTGASTSANQTAVTGSANGGTSASNSLLTGGIYNSTPITLTNSQQASLQLDSSGNLLTNSTVTIPGTVAVTQSTSPWVVSGTLTANQGGAPWSQNLTEVGGSSISLGQTLMASSVPVAIASDQSAIPVSESGTWTVQPGNTANTTPWLTTINQGGNSATVTGSNALKVDGSAVTQPISGTVTTVAPSTSSASLTSVSNSVSSFSVLASNSSRKGMIIYNNSTTSCNIAFAATASNISFSVPLTTHSTYLMSPPIYQGAVSSICTAATGTLQVTEF